MLTLMEACMASGSYWSGRLLGLLVAVSKECCQAFPGKALQLQLSSGGHSVGACLGEFSVVQFLSKWALLEQFPALCI